MIQKADWDSNFFGFNIGKIDLDPTDNIEEFLNDASKFKLVYIFSNKELTIPGLNLVDKKVIYEKKINNTGNFDNQLNNESISLFSEQDHSYEQLLNLAYLSGTYSRFRLDKGMPEGYFNKLYKLWLDNSLNKSIAFATIVSTSDNNVSGFVTLGKKDSKCSKIGLIAVDENYQGRKIGSKLLNECEVLSRKKGFSKIEVATQGNNLAACRLYEKNNFKVKSEQFIYHLWKK